ncbi:MAG: hypothetical protein ACKVPJ_09880 [Chitinophagales bacterium]
MTHTHKFDHLVANVVTKVAVAFPVQIIQEISFYNNKHLIAACFWKDESQMMQIVRNTPVNMQPSLVFYEELNDLSPTEIQITGIDHENNPFSISFSFDFLFKLTKKFAA